MHTASDDSPTVLTSAVRPLVEPLPAWTRDAFFSGFLVVVLALMIGYIWGIRTSLSPNDNSRWATVASLTERGSYEIDVYDTELYPPGTRPPFKTIDKVSKDGKMYSSKPPLLPTAIAGLVQLMKPLVGEPFNDTFKGPNGKEATHSGTINIYGKAAILVFQVLPFALMLWLYKKYLDRLHLDDFTWFYCMVAAGLATLTTGYLVTLNNHVIAASFGFFTAYLLLTIWYEDQREGWRFALAGLCAGWTAVNELTAGIFVLIALAIVFRADWKRALYAFVPPLTVVTAAFFYTNWLVVGSDNIFDVKSWLPAYLQKDLYLYPGSYWNPDYKKSGIDALNLNPESYAVYFFHLTFGHHGVFSLTPIWLLSGWGIGRNLRGQWTKYAHLATPILIVTLVDFGFYWLINDQRNYGGVCHGARWLLWLGSLWLMMLPVGVEAAARSLWGRRFAGAALFISIFSMADTLSTPWSTAWLQRITQWYGMVDY